MEKPSSDLKPAFVVGSAGHIDHGKTTLIRAITGVDLDVLPEEKERGITISLGFTHKAGPSGRTLAFVDVPGHERLVRTMIAGAVGIDAVLFCVSAAEGVMPQTQEHLDILSLLGVNQGVVAITHCDAVEADLRELCIEETREAFAGTFLEKAPIIETSAISGLGIVELEKTLHDLPIQPRNTEAPFRMSIDRVFHQKGFGSIVTGTAQSGRIHEGDDLLLLPGEEKVRVRGLEVHGHPRKQVNAGERTAINLAGTDTNNLKRGMSLASPDSMTAHSILDVEYTHLPTAPLLKNRARVRLLLGTREILAVIERIDTNQNLEGGQSAWLQLRCEQPMFVLPGDRFILRRESPMTTLGGGVVVDPWAPRFKSSHRQQTLEELLHIKAGNETPRIERMGLGGIDKKQANLRLTSEPKNSVWLGDRLFSLKQKNVLSDFLMAALNHGHSQLPLAEALPKRSLKKGLLLEMNAGSFDALIEALHQEGLLESTGPSVRVPGWKPRITTEQQNTIDGLLRHLKESGLSPKKLSEIPIDKQHINEIVALLASQEKIHRIAGLLYEDSVIQALISEINALLSVEGELTPGRFKELTGLSRKSAIPLLEFLDDKGVTKRIGNVRVTPTSYSQ